MGKIPEEISSAKMTTILRTEAIPEEFARMAATGIYRAPKKSTLGHERVCAPLYIRKPPEYL